VGSRSPAKKFANLQPSAFNFIEWGTAMTHSFQAAVRNTLSTIDAGITRVILLFWVSTLLDHRRHGRHF
jgi:hypothetical protein